LKTSPNIIRVIKLSWMKWTVCVACMGEIRNAYIFIRKTWREEDTWKT